MRLALLVVVSAIIYGSLYPFHFVSPPADIAAALAADPLRVSRGDALANLLLYMPLGLLVVVGTGRADRLAAAVVGATVLGALLSVSVEVAQLWLPPRTTALSDLVLNTVGAFLGGVLGARLARLLSNHARRMGNETATGAVGLFGALLLLAFLGWQGAPFVPSIDWQAWKDSLKPLLLTPDVSPARLITYGAAWLGVALIVAGFVRPAVVALVVVVLTGAVCAGKVLVVSRVLTPEVPLAGLLVAVAWALPPLRRVAAAPGLVALALAGVIVWEGVAQAVLAWGSPGGATFNWIPFTGFLGGSILVNVTAMFEKVFLYGTLVLALMRMGRRRYWWVCLWL